MQPVRTVFCPRCQTESEARLIYCTNCGAQLVEPHLSEYGPGLHGFLWTSAMYIAAPFVFIGIMIGWGWFVQVFENSQRLISMLKAPNAFALLLFGGIVAVSLVFLLVANKVFKK